MRELYNILNKIKNTSSKTGKETTLVLNKDNELLKETLKFLFDDLIVTGLSSKKIAKPMNVLEPHDLNLNTLFTYLKKNNTGKDSDIAFVRGFLNTYRKVFGQEIADMVKGIVIKDYPIGISKVTINKVYGKGFIYEFKVRKGSKFEGKLKPNVSYTQTVKLDGHRCVACIDKDGVKLFGRSGKLMEGLAEVEEELLTLYKQVGHPVVFDGELLAIDDTGNIPSDELFKVTSKILRTKGNKTGIKYILFDTLPLEEFKNGKSKNTYLNRREELERLVNSISGSKIIDIVDILYSGKDLAEIQRIQSDVEKQGYEGTMLDETNAYYTTSRTKTLLKFKTFHTVDLRVLRVEEHTRGNKLGSIVVDYKGYELGVGSGFTDHQRKLYWDNPELIEGKIVEVGYFELSTNDKGGESLRFPTFKQVRNDKNEVSYD